MIARSWLLAMPLILTAPMTFALDWHLEQSEHPDYFSLKLSDAQPEIEKYYFYSAVIQDGEQVSSLDDIKKRGIRLSRRDAPGKKEYALQETGVLYLISSPVNMEDMNQFRIVPIFVKPQDVAIPSKGMTNNGVSWLPSSSFIQLEGNWPPDVSVYHNNPQL
ncbi:MAG: hypothetical protein P9F19_08410 [Candidatus Contendobacter sp.]|nr:hypothetical protein [Candidatus Contendobacter sp.]MDG4557394.1 hypothetical protein [Candidatus Contendobacter sp.]